jgi:hypothetical protein
LLQSVKVPRPAENTKGTRVTKKTALFTALMCVGIAGLSAAPVTLTGTYVEARTSEIFAGACIVNGEAATAGREALLAWKVTKGSFNGVALDGMASWPLSPGTSTSACMKLAATRRRRGPHCSSTCAPTQAQRRALVAMAKALANRVIDAVAEVTPASIEFVAGERDIRVVVPTARLQVRKEMDHDSTCGNKKWFDPLATVTPRRARCRRRERVQWSVARHEVERPEQALGILWNLHLVRPLWAALSVDESAQLLFL